MNLFCFSLEGSIDSLYEAVQSSADGHAPPAPGRARSPAIRGDGPRGSRPGRSASMEMAPTQGSTSKRKTKRTHISRSSSDVEAMGLKSKPRTDARGGRGRRQGPAKRRERSLPRPAAGFEGRRTSEGWSDVLQREPSVSAGGPEPTSSSSRTQKAGGKPAGRAAREGSQRGSGRAETEKYIPALGLSCSSVGGTGCADGSGSPSLLSPRLQVRRAAGTALPGPSPRVLPPPTRESISSLPRPRRPRAEGGPARADVEHRCCRPLAARRPSSGDFAVPCGGERDRAGVRAAADEERDFTGPRGGQGVPRSFTDTDLTEPDRSTSFGKFEGLRHPPTSSGPEDAAITEEAEGLECNKSSGLGKKMKAISLTMRRKMGKKHHKSFTEDMGDAVYRDPDGEAEGCAPEIASEKTNNSLESLCSAQSSSSGVTTESNGSKRDSPRLEEDGSYPGQFCGRARVHTDFVPSPYDTDSLNLKAGDIISIISKPPMGIWTGMLNHKVGNFKFIYVDVIVEKEKEEEAPKIRPQKMCRRPRPNTLLELLEELHLQEYASALLLNGYQTVDDLKHLRDKHLIELNVRDPEHRRRLLAAADCHYTDGDELRGPEQDPPPCAALEGDAEGLRDSGCFIPSECSDPLKEEADPGHTVSES